MTSQPNRPATKNGLWRDLYDCYFLASYASASPDIAILEQRLGRFRSRLPRLSKRRRMSRDQFVAELRETLGGLTDHELAAELAGLLPDDEFAGLALRINISTERMIADLVDR